MLTGIPLFWTIHDNTFPPYLVRILASMPSRVIAVSEWLGDFYRPCGLTKKITVIPNGLDIKENLSLAGDLREESGVPAQASMVLWVGRLIREKAPHLFVQTARKIMEIIPDAYFVVVGDIKTDEAGIEISSYRDFFASIMECRELGKRLIMAGHRIDTDRFYAAADVVVYSAISPEGLPTVLLEAMFYARPVVASFIGGAGEIVKDGVTGILVPPDNITSMTDAIMMLLMNKEKSRAYGIAGRKYLEEKFDLVAQVKKIQGIYREISD
jgi:glycosyltransferase involved in cell wall biosynthesis